MDVVVLVVLFALFLVVLGLVVLGVVYLIGAAVGNREERVVLEFELPPGPTDRLAQVLDQVSPVMQAARYELAWVEETVACFERRYRPVWRILLAILLFPVGLLLLLWASTDSVVFQLLAVGQGSRIVVDGKIGHDAHGQLQRALAGLGEQRRIAGWYPDGSGYERFWDGDAWTDQTRAEQIVVGPRMKSVPSSYRRGS